MSTASVTSWHLWAWSRFISSASPYSQRIGESFNPLVFRCRCSHVRCWGENWQRTHLLGRGDGSLFSVLSHRHCVSLNCNIKTLQNTLYKRKFFSGIPFGVSTYFTSYTKFSSFKSRNLFCYFLFHTRDRLLIRNISFVLYFLTLFHCLFYGWTIPRKCYQGQKCNTELSLFRWEKKVNNKTTKQRRMFSSNCSLI
jgi:hypothetical protein